MKSILFSFLLLPCFGFAQIKIEGKIIDATTKQPIPYVNLESFKYKTGTQSNQDGVFVFELPQGKISDTLKISCVGYKAKYITNLSTGVGAIYELLPASITLSEVVIKKGKVVLKEVGVLEKTGSNFNPFNERLRRSGVQTAVLMKNEEKTTGVVKSVHFFVGRHKYDAPFRVRLYDNEKGLPGSDLLGKSLELVATKKNAWNEFDISEYQIKIPEKGFYVAIEWLANEKYASVSNTFREVVDVNGKKKKIPRPFTYYGPEIAHRIDSSYGLTYRKFLGTDWFLHRAGVVPKDGDRSKTGFADILTKATIEIIE
ncbi:MAG: carboxypeptidase-like regulatory domain-containing protein [Pedobacter sp.]|uniref:carboxypeptidase-like regulatory domain-containing protein n=1 Tax=Pedobacter sp. TaxID=1411316 RepID=UPI0028097B39|nr:carboxypeptidase-like regulatory domain-containing protein [Pedobacter sp.]MDQ8003759.1 carboxypeptidase-like regulatory domain-containing protein [Pedobacter sp.]